MTLPQQRRGDRSRLRRLATHPLLPVVVLTATALVAAAQGNPLTWAILGGLAGYSLSGSV